MRRLPTDPAGGASDAAGFVFLDSADAPAAAIPKGSAAGAVGWSSDLVPPAAGETVDAKSHLRTWQPRRHDVGGSCGDHRARWAKRAPAGLRDHAADRTADLRRA